MMEEGDNKSSLKKCTDNGFSDSDTYFSILRPILIQYIPILSTLFKKH